MEIWYGSIERTQKERIAKAISGWLRCELFGIAVGSSAAVGQVAPELVSKGLGRTAKQKDVKYEVVSGDDVAKCTGRYENRNGVRGLLILGPKQSTIALACRYQRRSENRSAFFFQDGGRGIPRYR